MTAHPQPLTDAEILHELREIDAIVDELLKRERRDLHKSKGGFIHFVRHHWPTIEPGTTMVEGWPLEAVCEHLEALARGEIQKILINVPPGFMKSLLTNVFLPAYVWGPLKQTNERFLSFSYAATLTRRDNRRLRDILQSEQYQEDWPHVELTSEGEERISISGTGWKLATSIGGVGTGERGGFVLCFPYHETIATEHGLMEIGKIVEERLPIRVWSFNEATNARELKPIVDWKKNPSAPIIILSSKAGDLACTYNHRILTSEGWKQAIDIRAKDLLVTPNGYSEVWEVNFGDDNPEHTYCLEVADNHTMLMSAGEIVCHNCDDPHNIADGESKVIREATVDWFRHAMQNRLNDIETSRIAVIMQRVNEGDVSGAILDAGMDYEHLMIPMEFDSARACSTSIGWSDPRTEDGELAWPERFPEAKVEQLRNDIGDFAFAGQYQQQPEVRGGSIFKRDDWQLWGNPDDPEDPVFSRFPAFDYLMAYLDCAYTEKEENDPSAMSVWGLFRDHEKRKPAVMLVYAWRARLQIHDLVDKTYRVASKLNVDSLVIENKASGISVSQELRRLFPGAQFGVVLDEPHGDKVARAHAVSHLWNAGQIWAPDKDWAQMVIDEMAVFPKGRYKDLTDTASGAMKRFRELGLLQTREEELVEAAESVQYRSGKYVQKPLYPGVVSLNRNKAA